MNALLVGIGAYLLIRGTGKVAAVKRFTYGLQGLPKVNYSGGNVVFGFKLLISNPSPEKFAIDMVSADIFIGTTFVGHVESKQAFEIVAYGNGVADLQLNVLVSNAAISLVKAITSPGDGTVLRMSGGVRVPGGTVPLELTQKLKV